MDYDGVAELLMRYPVCHVQAVDDETYHNVMASGEAEFADMESPMLRLVAKNAVGSGRTIEDANQ